LNVYGVDNFGYLQTNLHNLFMYLISPTLFWHRMGKIGVAVLAMAAIYTVFARLVRPAFGLLVAGCTATCSVWIVYTYASVPFLDGIASGFALLAIGMWVARSRPVRAWLTLGLLSGFMLFLTPNGWLMAVLWTWLTARSSTAGSRDFYIGATAVVVDAPMLLRGRQPLPDVTLVRQRTIEVALFLQQAAFMPFPRASTTPVLQTGCPGVPLAVRAGGVAHAALPRSLSRRPLRPLYSRRARCHAGIHAGSL
jgi:hypothetical protein